MRYASSCNNKKVASSSLAIEGSREFYFHFEFVFLSPKIQKTTGILLIYVYIHFFLIPVGSQLLVWNREAVMKTPDPSFH